MKKGDLVYYYNNKKRFYVVLNVKKYYHGYKNRVKVLCPSSGYIIHFLKEDLEMPSESR